MSDDLVDGSVVLAASGLTVQYRSLNSGIPGRNPLQRLGLWPTRTSKRGVDDVSLVARKGERIGLIGRNGSGKSTLLRALAGLEHIHAGTVMAKSKPVLLSVSPALIPDRTGYENIELGCLAMGLTPAEMKDIVPQVAELADLGDELHDPIKTYSAGMGGRLRFSIAAVNPNTDILLVDEALGTGDAAFQDRSEKAISQIVDNAGTIFFVSHVPSAVVKMCERAIWMFEGRPIMDGPSREVALTYQNWSNHTVAGEKEAARNLIESITGNYVETKVIFT